MLKNCLILVSEFFFLQKEKAKVPDVDELVLALRQGSEALMTSHQGATQAAVAVEKYQEAVIILEKRSSKVKK